MKKLRRLMAFVCAFVMALALCVPSTQVYADKDSEAINDAKSGVVLIQLVYIDAAGNKTTIQSGTGFLIDESYVITCYHVVHMDADTKVLATETLGVDFVNSEPSGLQVQLVVRGTSTIDLTETSANSELADFSVLKLEETINNRTYLPLGDSSVLNSSDNVYALGFPVISSAFQDAQFYSSDEVDVQSGSVTKIAEENNMKYIQHSATLSSGNSGGPLLNDAGEVVGINMAVITSEEATTATSYRAIAINEIITYLDDYGIPYIDGTSTAAASSEDEATSEADDTDSEEASEPAAADSDSVDKSSLSTIIDKAEDVDKSKYTSDSYEAFEEVLESAKSVYNNSDATQSEVDSATSSLNTAVSNLEETSSSPMLMIIIIVAVVVVLIIIIIIIVAVSGSKKKAKKKQQAQAQAQARPQPGTRPQQQPYQQPQAPQYQAQQQPYQQPQPQPYQQPQPQSRPYAPVQPEGAGETTVLNSGAGETTVLGGQPSAMLRRVKTGEAISVNKQTFTIGKERRRVDYCISDNTSISRAHAQIVCKGGEYFVVDQGSTNFTFVNGNKIAPHQEVKLNSGDKVKLSDEEFEFRI